MLVSILHRVTGDGMALVGLAVLVWWLGALASGSLRFTNMSTLLALAGLIVFLMGLLSEQLTNLQYKETEHDD